MIVTHISKFDIGREITDTNKNISPLDKIDISSFGFHRMLFTFPLYFIFIKKVISERVYFIDTCIERSKSFKSSCIAIDIVCIFISICSF